MSSFQGRVRDVLQAGGDSMDLKTIYKTMDPEARDDAEFKRRVRRALYHLCHIGSVERIGPATYCTKS